MQTLTRHTASTSMYSLTFCSRVMLPERHQWKPAVQAAAVMLRTPPSTASHRPTSHAHFSYMAHNFENALITSQSPDSSARTPRRAFALCRHIAGWTQVCNYGSCYAAIPTTRAPIANPPNSAQLGGIPYQ